MHGALDAFIPFAHVFPGHAPRLLGHALPPELPLESRAEPDVIDRGVPPDREGVSELAVQHKGGVLGHHEVLRHLADIFFIFQAAHFNTGGDRQNFQKKQKEFEFVSHFFCNIFVLCGENGGGVRNEFSIL